MTIDEILTEYESVWRAMELSGAPQFFGDSAGGTAGGSFAGGTTCAYIARLNEDEALSDSARRVFRKWTCPEPGCAWRSRGLSGAIIHTNNAHHRDFGWFAKNFREAWQKGIAA